MKRLPQLIYMTSDELDECILERTIEAQKHPKHSEECQTIFMEIAKLRLYADAKRWIESPRLKSGR
jgi:hypothetical protein